MLWISCGVSTIASLCLIEAMSLIPGNAKFHERVEFSTVAKYYMPKWLYYFVQIGLNANLIFVNIASIIVCAQTMDLAILAVMGRTCGFRFWPDPWWMCVDTVGTGVTPFGDVYILSLGFLLVVLMVVPLGFFNLDDNIIVQDFAFLLLCVFMGEWLVNFVFLEGLHWEYFSWFGWNQTNVIGTLLFNYSFVITIPSWMNEKKHKVKATPLLGVSSVLSTLIFMVLGVLGSMSYDFSNGQDILSAINGGKHATFIDKTVVYLFPFVVLASSIPVYSIIVRYNLMDSGICNRTWANIIAVAIPWGISIPFYSGNGLVNILNWSSLIIGATVNFILPFVFYILARRQEKMRRNMHKVSGHPTLKVNADSNSNSEVDNEQLSFQTVSRRHSDHEDSPKLRPSSKATEQNQLLSPQAQYGTAQDSNSSEAKTLAPKLSQYNLQAHKLNVSSPAELHQDMDDDDEIETIENEMDRPFRAIPGTNRDFSLEFGIVALVTLFLILVAVAVNTVLGLYGVAVEGIAFCEENKYCNLPQSFHLRFPQ
jgi:hypothetical protein